MSAQTQANSGGETPSWFIDALARPSWRSTVEVVGVEIAYAVWPSTEDRGRLPSVLLVHGTFANMHWWDHIAGLLASSRQVVALDLSGHGASGHRSEYDLRTWALEATTVLDAVEPRGLPAHVVGHSLGGVVAAVAASGLDSQVQSVSICESIRDPRNGDHPVLVPKTCRIYSARSTALGRFRTIPPGLATVPYVVDHVAARSIRQVEGGWTWKHDLNVGTELQSRMPPLDGVVAEVHCPILVVAGERGLVDAADLALLVTSGGSTVSTLTIPGAGHHLMLEQPQALAVAVEDFIDRIDGPLRDS